MKEHNARTAFEIDKNFYAEFDNEFGQWGVFGDETGFCYSLTSSQSEADDKAAALNNRKSLS